MTPVAGRSSAGAPITAVTASAYEIPTDAPESDGTLAWTSTTLVVAEVSAGGETGLGYTYGHAATAHLIERTLSNALAGMDALATGACWQAMVGSLTLAEVLYDAIRREG